jgi:hypothetical protein
MGGVLSRLVQKHRLEPGAHEMTKTREEANAPPTLRYEHGVILADKEFAIVHRRFSGHGRPRSGIAADIVRIADGVLAEHWDVLQDEATKEESQSALPMFGTTFPV